MSVAHAGRGERVVEQLNLADRILFGGAHPGGDIGFDAPFASICAALVGGFRW